MNVAYVWEKNVVIGRKSPSSEAESASMDAKGMKDCSEFTRLKLEVNASELSPQSERSWHLVKARR